MLNPDRTLWVYAKGDIPRLASDRKAPAHFDWWWQEGEPDWVEAARRPAPLPTKPQSRQMEAFK